MPRKLVYVIGGRRWLPLGRAAALLATSTATIKRLMSDGSLDWTQSASNSRTLVVDERMLLLLRERRGAAQREVKRRTLAATRTADQRATSMHTTAASQQRGSTGQSFGVFDRTWDPAPEEPPISGRDPGSRRDA